MIVLPDTFHTYRGHRELLPWNAPVVLHRDPTDVLYFVLIYTKKGLFQWPSYRGEGILATVVKIVHIQKALRYRQNL